MDNEEIAEYVHNWRPDETEFVILTRRDWDRVRVTVNARDRKTLRGVELVPLTLELPHE